MIRISLPIALAAAGALALGATGRPLVARTSTADPASALRIEAREREPGNTGTYHYVDELRLATQGGAPLVLTTAVEIGRLAPIPGPKFAVGDDRVLLLGWSSTGGGMQTIHALLLRIENKRVVPETQIAITTDRPSAGVILRRERSDKVLIGIPERAETAHEQDGWSLVLGPEQRLDWDQLRQLPLAGFERRTSDVVYFPPFFPEHNVARVTWISAAPNGLTVVDAADLAAAPIHVWDGARWLDTFPAYAEARLLCRGRIPDKPRDREYTAYATSRVVEAVSAFYATYAWDLQIDRDEDGMQLYGPKERELEIQPKSRFKLACGAEPTTHDSTIVVVSQRVERNGT